LNGKSANKTADHRRTNHERIHWKP
jgi:hypothetical protein